MHILKYIGIDVIIKDKGMYSIKKLINIYNKKINNNSPSKWPSTTCSHRLVEVSFHKSLLTDTEKITFKPD